MNGADIFVLFFESPNISLSAYQSYGKTVTCLVFRGVICNYMYYNKRWCPGMVQNLIIFFFFQISDCHFSFIVFILDWCGVWTPFNDSH